MLFCLLAEPDLLLGFLVFRSLLPDFLEGFSVLEGTLEDSPSTFFWDSFGVWVDVDSACFCSICDESFFTSSDEDLGATEEAGGWLEGGGV